MKVLDTKIMRGPNYWSNYRKQVIVVKLDLEELEEKPTDKIEGFAERLVEMLPSLYEHRCSEGHKGGFFDRVREGTWMGHVIEHISLELQTLAGMFCGYGRTRSTHEKGVYHVVFAYRIDKAGLYAFDAAMRIVEAIMAKKEYDVKKDVEELKKIWMQYGLGPSTGAIVDEAKKRRIPFRRLNDASLVALGYGCKQKVICSTVTSQTTYMAFNYAKFKETTRALLSRAYVPVPGGKVVTDETELKTALSEMAFPVVIKPSDGNHGRGVTTNIQNMEEALAAYKIASGISGEVIVEEFIQGDDYRFLLVNHKLVAVAKRTPAMVMGDGTSTIEELVKQTNLEPERGENHEKNLTTIKIDEITMNILRRKGLTEKSVLPLGQILFLKDTANLSTGGTSTDVTDVVHPYNKFLAERVARLVNLDICGIDVVAKDIRQPLSNGNGSIIEVNAGPGLRMHLSPSKGTGRNVAEPIIDMLFPHGDNGRIPIVAVTGTNGKTTTVRLVAHMAKQSGYNVGYNTTEGVYIGDQTVHYGDCSGPSSQQTVLSDPWVNFAVLECARGGILRSGLGYDVCDISIITNVGDDHLGMKDIHTIEQMADVKCVVARSTTRDGYAILNADDDLVYAMRHEVDSNVALFSMHADNPRILDHCADDGYAAIIEKGYVVVCKGRWKTRVEKVANIPICFKGKAEFMVKNVLPAVLAAYIRNISTEDIRKGLRSFIPSPEQTPGRMNLFSFKNFDVMVDYAHNAHGFKEIKKFMDKVNASVKIGLISGTGDRRDEDIRELGRLSAEMFDEIIIRHDTDLRGRSKEDITRLLREGISSVKDMPVKVISSEPEALDYATSHAKKGAFIFMCADKVFKTIELVKQALEKEKRGGKQVPVYVQNHNNNHK